MKKRIMILGAGVYQVPLIQKAKEMGLETIVVSPKGAYPGIPLADVWLDLDTTNQEAVILAATHYGISAVLTTGTDVSVPTMAAVAQELQLYGPDVKAAQTVSSKTKYRTFLQEHNLNCPSFQICTDFQDALGFFHGNPNKTVLKPDDSSGSRGVSILEPGLPEPKVMEAYTYAKQHSRNGIVCAESFLDGFEVGGDAFVVNGHLHFLTTTCKHLEGVLVRGHSRPGPLSKTQESLVKEELSCVVRKLGYKNGPLNFDVMIGKDLVTTLEMGLRNGGNGIQDLIRYSTGVCLAEFCISHALEMPIPPLPTAPHQTVSSFVFGSDVPGTLESLPDLERLKEKLPEVIDMILARTPGDHVEPLTHNANLIGYLVLNCGSDNYREVCSRVTQHLNIVVTP